MDIAFLTSVDMVTMTTVFKQHIIQKYMDRFGDMSNVKGYESTKITDYRYSYIIHSGVSTVYVGVQHNARNKESGVVDIMIKFNPNKIDYDDIRALVAEVFINNQFTRVKSIDVALDMPINIKSLFPVKPKNISHRYIDNTGDDVTWYFRKRGSHGHTKIYNKRREVLAKNNYDIGMELTRYEVTLLPGVGLDVMPFYKFEEDLLLSMYVSGDVQLGFDVNGTDKVLMLACLEHPEFLNELSRDKKKKIMGYISKYCCQIDLEINSINKVINNYFSTL